MTVRRRKNGRYMIDIVVWRGDERVRIRKSSGAKTRFEALEREREERAKLGYLVRGSPGPCPTFSDFARTFIETYATNNNKPSEVDSKQTIIRKHLDPSFGKMKLDAIGPQHIEQHKARQLASSLSPKSINNQLTVFRRILMVAHEWGKLAVVPPIRWMKTPQATFDFLSFEEAVRLETNSRFPMISVALRTGLRHGELLALRWEDVDLTSGRMLVRRAIARGIVGTPKNNKSREVELGDDVMACLRVLPSRFRNELIFPGPDGRLLTRGECRQPLESACKKAGLRRIGWHVLRHTFASHLVMRGVPLKVVMELLGHAKIDMTMRYSHLSPDVRREAVRLLDRPKSGAAAIHS